MGESPTTNVDTTNVGSPLILQQPPLRNHHVFDHRLATAARFRYDKSVDVNEIIEKLDLPGLKVLRYPDPRLREAGVDLPRIDAAVRALTDRMFELMFEFRGVGLAAQQVGVPARLFVAAPSFQEEDRRVYINPRLVSLDGSQEGEEGCLSFPNITCRVKRYNFATIRAMNLDGTIFEESGEELVARIFQHELDHLDGRLLVDRMGSVAKLANRRALKDLEEQLAK
jgi:peptide deformylase